MRNQVTVINVPAGEYLSAGETYTATQARPTHDVRLTGASGASTYMRAAKFRRAVACGAIVVTE